MRLFAVSQALLLAFSLAAACSGVDTSEQKMEGTPTPEEEETPGPNPTPSSTTTPPVATPTPTPNPGGTEVEPNDTHATATPLGGSGSHTFSGACAGTFDSDNFRVQSAAGTLSATLTWNDAAGDDLDLWISSNDYSTDEGDVAIPPGDSPAQVSASAPAAQDMYVEVFCFSSAPGVTYTGTFTVP